MWIPKTATISMFNINILPAGLYPSTFADPRFRKEDSVFVTHKKSLKAFAISAS
jgi:hypothetical protein